MTWARAVLVLRHLNLEDRLKSQDRHERGRALLELERSAEAAEDE